MDLRIKDLVTLEDNNEYIITSVAHYNGFDYYYLVDVNNNDNIKFCRLIYRGDHACLVEIDDDEMLKEIVPLLYSSVKNEIMS